MSKDETPANLEQAETLMKRHEALLTTMDTNDDKFNGVLSIAHRILQEEHFAADKSKIRWKKSQREEIRTAKRLLNSLTESKTNIFFTHSFKIVRNFMTRFRREMFLFRKILTGQQEPSTVSGLDIKLSNLKFRATRRGWIRYKSQERNYLRQSLK